MCIVTARKRSLGQGNIFTPVCHSVHSGGMCGCWGVCALMPGGVHGCGGACMVAGGVCAWLWGACMVAWEGVWLPGGMHGCRGACMVAGGHAWLLGGACVGYDEIRSMSGRYASYWNVFLFCFHLFLSLD